MRQLNKSAALYKADLAEYLENLRHRLMNQCLAGPGLVIGSSSKPKVKIANTVVFSADGVLKTKTTAEVAFTATTHDIAPNASTIQEACYLLMLAANGDATIVMGDIATGSGAAKVPEIPATGTPVGYVRVAVDAGATLFNATTDDLDAAHLTVTYYDLGFVNNSFDSVIM